MEHQSSFPTRQVHLVSTAGLPFVTGDTKADLVYFFKTPIVNVPTSYDIVLSCVSASIPYIWTNINDTNNVFIIYSNRQTLLYTLPSGNYNINDIITILNKQFATINLSYDMNTHFITIRSLMDFNVEGSLATYLGFFDFESSGLSITSTKPVNLIKTTSVYVELPDMQNESFDSRTNGQTGVICRIPVSGSPGNLLTWTNIFGARSKLALKQINHIRVRLVDDDLNILDMRGFTWTISLQFDVVESVGFVEGDWLRS